MNNKTNRKSAVASIINSHNIHTQDELIKALEKKGIVTTQATLSRDIKELGALKVPDGDGFLYKIPVRDGSKSRMIIRNIVVSGQMCVLHAQPAFAPAIASIVDAQGIEGVMGTIAGDDTILVILKEDTDPDYIKEKIKSLF